jgi:hypothetical protein
MATVGRGVYATAVHEFFDGLRSYDVPRAVAVLAPDADMQSPWGAAKDAAGIEAILTKLVAPSMERPSFTIANISGDGSVTNLEVSTSGRFGKGAIKQSWRILHLHGKVHHIVIA